MPGVTFDESAIANLLATITIAAFVRDECGAVVDANESFANLVRCELSKIKGVPWRTLLVPGWTNSIKEQGGDAPLTIYSPFGVEEYIQITETEIKRAPGKYLVLCSEARSQANLAGTICSLEKNNRELELKLGELVSARDRADAIAKTKSAFLATMSHEIRTPMNGVLGMIELLLETPLSMDQRELTLTARESARSLLALVNDILDFSKIEAGKLALNQNTIELRQFISSLEPVLATSIAKKNLEYVTFVDPQIPTSVIGDSGRLRQVFLNMLGNSIKFCSIRGAVIFQAHLEKEIDGTLWIQFHVSDTGIGIAPEKQQHVFEAFNQADSTISRDFGGTGLGLAISSQLLSLMCGTISLRSMPKVGTTFTLTIPFARVASLHGSDEAQIELPNLHVLVAEDNAVNQRVITAILERAGHKVHIVENGEEVVKAHKSGKFDLILMDIHMPLLDGTEASRLIRSGSEHPNIPIIALTANALSGNREKYLAAGMDGYVPKPIERRTLFSEMLRTYNLSRSRVGKK